MVPELEKNHVIPALRSIGNKLADGIKSNIK